jgi:hypothetical protein
MTSIVPQTAYRLHRCFIMAPKSRIVGPEEHIHGPENAQHELRKAYNTVVETGVTHLWDRKPIQNVNAQETHTLYRRAYQAFRQNNRLAAERWARATKHLSRAFWHEAKIAYLQGHLNELPVLEGTPPEDLNLHEKSDTTQDFLQSLAEHIPPGLTEMPEEMKRYLSRAQRHLDALAQPELRDELLRAEMIKAAHEYGRVIECLALGYEAESKPVDQNAA